MFWRKTPAAIALLALVAFTAVLVAPSAEARKPGPPKVPALNGTVKDACTGAKVSNLSVSVEKPPSPPTAPSKVAAGSFRFDSLPGGQLRLKISAPGYAVLGDAANPGVDVVRPAGPPTLPSPPQAEADGVSMKILLAPSPLPTNCVPKKVGKVTALTGAVINACSGGKVANLTVTLENPPGLPITPSKVAAGSFKFTTLPGGVGRLRVAAPGFGFLGFAAQPGIDVVLPPGPPVVPAPQAVAVGAKVKIFLGPSAGCLHVG